MTDCHFNSTTHWSIVMILCTIDVLLLSPIQFFCAFKFIKKSRHNVLLSKGYPSVVSWINIFVIGFTLIFHPQFIIAQLSPLHCLYPELNKLLIIMNHCEFYIIFYGITIFSLLRYWLMYYDQNCCYSHINKEWKTYLNENIVTKDFWLKYRNTLGNRKYLLIISVFMYFIICTTNCIVIIMFFNDIQYINYINLYHGLLFLIPALIAAILYIKAPSKLKNVIFLKSELKSELYVLLIILPIPCLIFILYIDGNIYKNQTIQERISAICASQYMLLATYWTVRRYFMAKKYNKSHHGQYTKTYSKDNIHHKQSKLTSKIKQCTLNMMLSNEQYSELFIQHLCREFAIETALCYIELVQFKHLMDDTFKITLNHNTNNVHDTNNDDPEGDNNNNDDDFYDYNCCKIHENKSIPKSSIVFQSNNHETMEDFLEIAHKLYYKYIYDPIDSNSSVMDDDDHENGYDASDYDEISSLTVNISGTLRNSYDTDMNMNLDKFIEIERENKIDINDLFEYFDTIICEMYALMNITYKRFIESDMEINVLRPVLNSFNTSAIGNTLHTDNN